MVLREISSRDAHAGDPIYLEVAETVRLADATIARGNEARGIVIDPPLEDEPATRSRRVIYRLSWVESDHGRRALEGEPRQASGRSLRTSGIGGRIAARTPLVGLFYSGAPGKLKAGEIVTGFVEADGC